VPKCLQSQVASLSLAQHLCRGHELLSIDEVSACLPPAAASKDPMDPFSPLDGEVRCGAGTKQGDYGSSTPHASVVSIPESTGSLQYCLFSLSWACTCTALFPCHGPEHVLLLDSGTQCFFWCIKHIASLPSRILCVHKFIEQEMVTQQLQSHLK
jgi:hypothetical protein